MSRARLGARGEELAAQFLARSGLEILERNWRCHLGELDIIAREGNDLVFVEVKTRSSLIFGHPFESVTATKVARLRRLAAAWCTQHSHTGDSVRLDAVSVLVVSAGQPTIEHIRGIS